jgi:prepilin-type N-terminal cleavage/methylation domain-containing protein
MHRRRPASTAGFTLIEILVALVLIGLLVGTLVPTVIGQLANGELNRVQEDVQGVGTAAKAFRVDVTRWPGDLEDLIVQPLTTTADTVLTGGQYPAGLVARWNGPYLELGNVATAGLPTALGGTIVNRLSTTTWNTKSFLTVKVVNIGQADAMTISQRVDGDTAISAALETSGKVRWKAGASGADTLIYLGSPIQ